MSAYIVFIRERVHDEFAFSAAVAAGIEAQQASMRPLAYYGDFEVLEGAPAHSVVLIEFPSMEAAREWYAGSSYQTAKRARDAAAEYRVILMDGRQDHLGALLAGQPPAAAPPSA